MTRWLIALTLLSACSKKDDKPAADPKGTTAPKAGDDKVPAKDDKPAKQPFTAAWLGKTVAAPGEIGKVKLGSTIEEAKKASPMADQAGTQESEIEGVAYAFSKDLDGILTDVMLRLPAGKQAVIEEAWGPGQKADRGGKPVVVWFNPETGVRAAYDEDGDRAYLRFEPYTPLVKLLGDGPNVALLDKPFAGKTKAELAALYPALATKDGSLRLPATEWEFGDHINVSPYPLDGAIESLAFSIPFNKQGKGEAEVMDVITAKWGKPKGEVPFGSVGSEKTFVYNKKDPHVEVTGPGGYNPKSITIRLGGK